jgi:hypothetical protein
VHPDARVEHSAEQAVPGAKAHRVRSVWQDESGTRQVEDALLMIHGDGVYILRVNADAETYPALVEHFEAVARSDGWLR